MKDSILGPLAFNFVINDIFLKISAYLNLKVPKQEILAKFKSPKTRNFGRDCIAYRAIHFWKNVPKEYLHTYIIRTFVCIYIHRIAALDVFIGISIFEIALYIVG